MGTIDAATRTTVDAFLERARTVFPIHSALLFGSRAGGGERTAPTATSISR